jgi:hypothetical protein
MRVAEPPRGQNRAAALPLRVFRSRECSRRTHTRMHGSSSIIDTDGCIAVPGRQQDLDAFYGRRRTGRTSEGTPNARKYHSFYIFGFRVKKLSSTMQFSIIASHDPLVSLTSHN